ncbi:hypothetical protein UPYG_G00040570 [Umbra pygmaea]|uniref:Phosphatidylinositol-specific phospholipase C X domain-containing protein n=1 Tax=Umbra pygmaea TaxID=75934 RepID=A0ABD0YBU7_UMBPY
MSIVSDVQSSLKELPLDSWMGSMPSALWDVPLWNLAIPGSHNAITYCLDKSDHSPVDLAQPDLLQKMDKYMKPLIRPFLHKWGVTQELTVKEQLDCGVRYLDLRIAHRPNDTSADLYFYHGLYTTLTVESVLQDVRAWLDAHPKEVVILSFSHFMGLNPDLHTGLISTIRNIFTSKLCPTTKVVTLRSLWSLGYQVIASYEHSIVHLHCDLWPHIPYWWANKCKAQDLIELFEHRKQQGRPGGFFVTGINLTVDLRYICSHPTESLKDVVMFSNPALQSWVRAQVPGSHTSSLNIVAGDFVSESDFITTVITLNEHLLNGSM